RMRKWRRHTVEFKRQVVERMKTCENIGALARELKLQRKLLYTWKYQIEGHPEPRHANLATTAEERKDKQLRDEITKLKASLLLSEPGVQRPHWIAEVYRGIFGHPDLQQ